MIGKQVGRSARPTALFGALLLSTAIVPAMAQDAPRGSEEVTVTAQRRSEAIQKVPIAVSAFSQDSLQKQKLDGGPDLVKAIPNVNFSKGNFTGSNFSIRGIGAKAVAASGDAGTAVHLNDAPLLSNNLFETDFYDMQAVEVLRGPQGTLYGRNASSGVINLKTRMPEMGVLGGNFRAEYGNFNTIKLRGAVNVPFGDKAALRLAGFYLERDGYGTNLVTGNDADDRNLYGVRATFAFEPADNFRVFALVDVFNEDDSRSRIGKQFCTKDPVDTSIGGVGFSANATVRTIQQGFFNQGCAPSSIYDPSALGTVDSRATLGGLFGYLGGFQTGDAYAGKMQTPDIRDIESTFDPIYRSSTNIYQFGADWDLTNELTLSGLVTYAEFDLYTRQDYNRYVPTSSFNASPNAVNLVTTPAALGGLGVPAAVYAALYPTLFPGGVVDDPQNGDFNRFTTSDISSAFTEQFSAELRLASAYDGPFNFSVGANYISYNATGDYFVMFNTGTAWYQVGNALQTGNPNCTSGPPCVGVDPNQDPNREGHNYYDAYSPYELESKAVFGEVYWDVTDTIKITLGVRYTDDRKEVTQYAYFPPLPKAYVSLGRPGYGLGSPEKLAVEFQELTGRAGFDVDLQDALGGESTLYAFYTRGYKSGGLNSPCSAGPGVICGAPTFQPEFINAYEIGLKNQFMDKRLTLNLTGFYYDYKDYQISRILNRASTNDNIDAEVFGAEFESSFEVVEGLRINANVGYLSSEIKKGEFPDEFNLTGGNPALTLMKTSAAANCVIPTASAAAILATSNALSAPSILLGACTIASNAGLGQPIIPGGPPAAGTAAGIPGAVAPYLVSAGVPVSLIGNELPNAPEWTVSIGAQYTFNVDAWDVTIRGDYYYQSGTFSRIWNAPYDRLNSWDNVNFTVTVLHPESGWGVDAYIKNALDDDVITDTYLTDASSGMFRNGFTNDPRTIGIAISKEF